MIETSSSKYSKTMIIEININISTKKFNNGNKNELTI